MLSEIYNCHPHAWENPSSFATRFNGLVSKYIHTTGHVSDESGKQWSIVMFKNTNLSADIQNALTFKLTTN